jgi:hypothetical protein
MALCDHLRAEEDIDFTAVYRFKGRLCTAFFSGGVGIDSKHARFWEQCVQIFFNTLGATPERLQIHIAAGGTRRGYPELKTAVVTAQTAFWFVQHHESGTPLAIADPSARITMHHRRVTATIEK